MGRPLADEIFVIASGPSLTREQCEATKGRRVLSIANTYEWLPHALWHYAADVDWWAAHHDKVHIPERYAWSLSACRKYGLKMGARLRGRNSGTHGLCLAAELGAKRIVMLGYDFQHTGGRAHYFGDHPPSLRNAKDPDLWLKALPPVVARLGLAGVELINCTPVTAIPTALIQRATLDEVL